MKQTIIVLFLLIFGYNVIEAQTKKLTGIVTEVKSGLPLPGVTVLIKGTQNGTTTDFDGKFSLKKGTTEGTLVFSFVGLKTLEVPINNQTVFTIAMEENAAKLEEVVVVGYGTQKKTNITSAVASVKSDELTQSSVANISNALVGKLPGLIATQRSGQPGSNGADLLIRGISTTGNSSPLIIVDGVQRAFSQLDPNTIETVTILKDASAAAVYGVRGANGVILVTTKRGTTGAPVITYTAELTTTRPTEIPQYLGSYEYALLFNEAKINEGKSPLYTPDDLEKYKTGSDPLTHPNTDWYGIGLKSSGIQQQHNVSISGGTKKINYFVSGGYISEGGLADNINYKRYNFRSNLDFQITEAFKVSLDLSGRQESRESPATGVGTFFGALSRTPPTKIAYFPNGLAGENSQGGNPIEEERQSGSRESVNRIFLANVQLEYKVPKIQGLIVKAYVAIDRLYNTTKTVRKKYVLNTYNSNTEQYTPVTRGQSRITQNYFEGAPPSGSGVVDPTITYNATLNYDKTFAKIHQITGLLGVEKAINKSSSFNASRLDLVSNALPELDFGDPNTEQNGGNAFNTARLGYLARVTYAYDSKYLFEASFRYDASENFAKKNRWGFFPSFSAGWRIAQENFMTDIDFINELKLRGSWGRLGNDRIDQFQYLDAFEFSGTYFVGNKPVQTLRPGVIANPDVTWETATIRNIGFDLEVLERKLAVEFDYFSKRTKNILEAPTRIVPNFIGATLPRENFGIVDNKGFEISLTHRNSIGSLDYWVRANYTNSKNTIVEIGEPSSVSENLRITGRPIGSRFGLIAEGFFQSDDDIKNHADQSGFGTIAPGDIKYKDISGPEGVPDKVINNHDRAFMGVVNSPNTIYGFSFGANYKRFDFSAQFQGARDFNVYLSEEAAFPFFNGGKVLEKHLDRWTPDNPHAKFPRLLTEDTNNREVSSFWLQNANYIRLKNIELGYNFPKSLLSNINVDKLRLYLSGLNVFTVSDVENFDPEAPSGRGSFYPQTKSFTLGLNVSF